MDSADTTPDVATIDPNTPSVARAYSYLLGGKDYYAADLAVVKFLEETFKNPYASAMTNRRWLHRVVRWLTRHAGIDQFLDCGSGLPTDDNVHQVAQRLNPEARVVYSDNDPTVQAHGRALLEDNDRSVFVAADLTDPDTLLHDPAVRRLLDFDRPIAMIQCFTLHHEPDEPRPVADVMRTYVDALPRGSYVALTHITYPPAADDPDGTGRAMVDELRRGIRDKGMNSGYFREYDHVRSFFDGLELVEPGLVPAADWWPDGPVPRNETDAIVYGGVGKKV
ncbi:SAM-dependent methyltransferase [Saccharomonospora iraqiensis]|uniref:SAM-dependent methyltransferase n=1 Tax=Saccharomonospora iraqiensis TaxID=52698 RepID=UPI00022E0073|nr:SAM-dependent methyltransferase [Saccharomonospora iraqiensis]